MAIDSTPWRASRSTARRAAVEAHPFGDAEPAAARHQRGRRRQPHVPDVLLVAAPQLELVAEAVGGEEPGDGALALDQRVVGDRGGVDDRVEAGEERAESDALPCRQLLEPGHHGARGVVGRGERLLEHDGAVAAQEREVGEGAADIDADAAAHARRSPVKLTPTPGPLVDEVDVHARPRS
jgi:hypothetical protein